MNGFLQRYIHTWFGSDSALKYKAVLEPRVSPAFAITYFCNHCNIRFENTSKYVDTLTFFPKTWTKGHWPLDDLWPHVSWGHMCDSTQGSLCPSPWQYINVCGYGDQFCKIPHMYTHTYYVHTTYILHTTYRMSDHIVSYWTQFRRDNYWTQFRRDKNNHCTRRVFRERGQNNPSWLVHQESFTANPTIGSQTSHDKPRFKPSSRTSSFLDIGFTLRHWWFPSHIVNMAWLLALSANGVYLGTKNIEKR